MLTPLTSCAIVDVNSVNIWGRSPCSIELPSWPCHRGRLVLALTVVAVVAMGAIGFGAFGKLLGGGFEDPSAPSARAQELIDEKFGGESQPGPAGPGRRTAAARLPRRRARGPHPHLGAQGEPTVRT